MCRSRTVCVAQRGSGAVVREDYDKDIPVGGGRQGSHVG